jgi:tryptophan-rich sensory protein
MDLARVRSALDCFTKQAIILIKRRTIYYAFLQFSSFAQPQSKYLLLFFFFWSPFGAFFGPRRRTI